MACKWSHLKEVKKSKNYWEHKKTWRVSDREWWCVDRERCGWSCQSVKSHKSSVRVLAVLKRGVVRILTQLKPKKKKTQRKGQVFGSWFWFHGSSWGTSEILGQRTLMGLLVGHDLGDKKTKKVSITLHKIYMIFSSFRYFYGLHRPYHAHLKGTDDEFQLRFIFVDLDPTQNLSNFVFI